MLLCTSRWSMRPRWGWPRFQCTAVSRLCREVTNMGGSCVSEDLDFILRGTSINSLISGEKSKDSGWKWADQTVSGRLDRMKQAPWGEICSQKQQYLVTNIVCEGEKEQSQVFKVENSGKKIMNLLRCFWGTKWISVEEPRFEVKGLEIATYRDEIKSIV